MVCREISAICGGGFGCSLGCQTYPSVDASKPRKRGNDLLMRYHNLHGRNISGRGALDATLPHPNSHTVALYGGLTDLKKNHNTAGEERSTGER